MTGTSEKSSGIKENSKPVTRSSDRNTSRVVAFDEWLSRKLAVCSTADSKFGQLRPLMRLLEYSCHGVPWLVGIVAAILASHQVELQEKLLNIFLGRLVLIMNLGTVL